MKEKENRGAAPSFAFASGALDLQDVLHVLREKAWLIVVCVLVALFAGLSHIARSPEVYRAQSTLRIDPEPGSVMKFADPANTDLGDKEVLQTTILSFWSPSLLNRVAVANDLTKDPKFMPLPPSGENSLGAVTGKLGAILDVEQRPGTRLLDISIAHDDPKTAQKLANSFADQFIRELLDSQMETVKLKIEKLNAEKKLRELELTAAETKLQDYIEKNDAASLEDRQDTVVAKLQSLSAELAGARTARLRLETDLTDAKQHAGDADSLLEIPSVAAHPQILAVKDRITELEIEVAALRLRYTPKHPKLADALRSLEEAKATLVETALSTPPLIEADFKSALAHEKTFEAALKDQEALALELNRKAIPYNVLKRDVDTGKVLYESILSSLKETSTAQAIKIEHIRVFREASLPKTPFSPKKDRIIAMSLLGGLIAGLALSFAIYTFDSSLRTVDQGEEKLGLKVLGAIPRNKKMRLASDRVVVSDSRGSTVAEAFRSLRAALGVYIGNEKGHITLFTSALPAEGKTFTAVNYSVSVAQQGLRTLLIDADLRQPMVDSVMPETKNSSGLSEYLSGNAKFTDVIHSSGHEKLDVLPAGRLAENPAELLSGTGFANLLAEAAKEYDRIVVDTAPIIALSDTLLLVPSVDSVCLVVRARRTPLRLIKRALQLLEFSGATIPGFVLNQLPRKPGMGNYYYYSAGKYGERVYVPDTEESEKPAGSKV